MPLQTAKDRLEDDSEPQINIGPSPEMAESDTGEGGDESRAEIRPFRNDEARHVSDSEKMPDSRPNPAEEEHDVAGAIEHDSLSPPPTRIKFEVKKRNKPTNLRKRL